MQPFEAPFEFDVANCFHCPRPLWARLGVSAIGIMPAIVASFFWESPRQWLRAFSKIVGVLTAIWYLLGTVAVVRFGILWPTTDGDEVLIAGVRTTVTTTRAADQIYLVAWYATTLLLALGSRFIAGRFGVKR